MIGKYLESRLTRDLMYECMSASTAGMYFNEFSAAFDGKNQRHPFNFDIAYNEMANMRLRKQVGAEKSGGVWNSMKVLYIGHFREVGGWSNAAIDFALALDSVGVDVVCKDIKLTDKSSEVPNRIKELEQKTLSNIDYCIQNVLPHHLIATDKFKKNIAYFFSESTPITSSWISNLNLMDEVWVPNSTNCDALQESKIETDVKIVQFLATFLSLIKTMML